MLFTACVRELLAVQFGGDLSRETTDTTRDGWRTPSCRIHPRVGAVRCLKLSTGARFVAILQPRCMDELQQQFLGFACEPTVVCFVELCSGCCMQSQGSIADGRPSLKRVSNRNLLVH